MAGNQRSGKAGPDADGLEALEFVTLSGHEYVCVHLEEDGWKREAGFLERRRHDVPVAVDRRRPAAD